MAIMGWRADEANEIAKTKERRAAALRPLTEEERRWIKRAKRLLRDKPDSLWLLASLGSLSVYLDTNGEAIAQVDDIKGYRVDALDL